MKSDTLPLLILVMTRQRLFLLLMSLLLIALSWWGVVAARAGLVVRSLSCHGVPMLYVASQQVEKTPGVLMVHGTALMEQPEVELTRLALLGR